MFTLCGALLGMLFDLLRVARGHYRPNVVVGAVADLMFWGVATLALASTLFAGNWGDRRFYVVIALLSGLLLYYWLAGPFVRDVAQLVIDTVEWLVNLLVSLVLRLVWAPIVFLAGLVWGGVLTLGRWALAIGKALWRLLDRLGLWIMTPFIGPYRFMRLHYLLTKRRVKRRLRHWLLGPPRPKNR
jgi:spore cortex biosynthesis protein YabQ